MVFRVSLEGGADSLAEWSKDWDRFREEVREKIQMGVLGAFAELPV